MDLMASPVTHDTGWLWGETCPHSCPQETVVEPGFEPGLSAHIPGQKAYALPSGPFVSFASWIFEFQVGSQVAQKLYFCLLSNTEESWRAPCLRLSPRPWVPMAGVAYSPFCPLPLPRGPSLRFGHVTFEQPAGANRAGAALVQCVTQAWPPGQDALCPSFHMRAQYLCVYTIHTCTQHMCHGHTIQVRAQYTRVYVIHMHGHTILVCTLYTLVCHVRVCVCNIHMYTHDMHAHSVIYTHIYAVFVCTHCTHVCAMYMCMYTTYMCMYVIYMYMYAVCIHAHNACAQYMHICIHYVYALCVHPIYVCVHAVCVCVYTVSMHVCMHVYTTHIQMYTVHMWVYAIYMHVCTVHVCTQYTWACTQYTCVHMGIWIFLMKCSQAMSKYDH